MWKALVFLILLGGCDTPLNRIEQRVINNHDDFVAHYKVGDTLLWTYGDNYDFQYKIVRKITPESVTLERYFKFCGSWERMNLMNFEFEHYNSSDFIKRSELR